MKKIKLGKYQHYKGNFYEVLGIARHSETLEELVVYRAKYDHPKFGKDSLWVRPKKMFLEKVEIEGKKVPRFRYESGGKMKIGIVGSMQHTEKMMKIRDELIQMGYQAFMTNLAEPFVGKTNKEKEKIKIFQKQNKDAIREFWRLMQGANAILVANFDKNGIKNYIGGNTLMEIGFAHVLGQKIFLLNPIPNIPYYKTEIEAVKPIILNGDLSKIK